MIKFIFLLIFTVIQFGDVSSNLRTSFDPFRYLSNQFLQTIQPNTTALNVTINLFILKSSPTTDYKEIFLSYWRPYLGYLILIIIGILFLVFFTLTGLIFCCCRVCCKKCGATPSPRSTKNTKCIRITFNVFLLFFVSIILIGAIIAMASCFVLLETTNSINQTSDPNGNLFYGLNSTISNINSYINKIAQNILNDGVNVIRNTLNQALSMFDVVINTFTQTYTNGIEFVSFILDENNFISKYIEVQPLTVNLANAANTHEIRSNNFSSYLSYLVSELNSTLTDELCNNTGICDKVKSDLKNLVLGFNMSIINYIGDKSAANVSLSYDIADFQNSVNVVSGSVNYLLDNVNSTFTGFIKDLINVLNGSNVITNIVGFVNNSVLPIQNTISNYQNNILSFKLGSESIANGGLYKYVYYVFCGLCGLIGIILIIIILFYIGLCFGVCGAPNFEDPACCNKGAGSGFLMGGVAISFIFGWLIMLITMILFVSGGVMTTEVCSYLNSNDAQQISVIDYLINHYTGSSPIVVGNLQLPKINFFESLMLRCPNSTNFRSAFNIPSEYLQNLSASIYQIYVDKPINDTIANIFNYSVGNINTTDLERSLGNVTQLIQSWQAIISPDTIGELRKNFTKISNTQEFRNNVNILIYNLTSLNYSDSAIRINNSIYDFTTQLNLMRASRTTYLLYKILFDSSIVELNTTLMAAVNALRILKSSLLNTKNSAIIASQSRLRDSARTMINRTLTNFIDAIGDCKGIYEAYRSGINTACIVTVSPLNNIWMGLGWFLLFIIPAIVLAVKLSPIYRISHIESESAAYNHAYMASNQFLSRNDLEMIRLGRPHRI